MRTSSIGLLPPALSPSTTIEWPLVAIPLKRCFSIHVVLASVITVPDFLSAVIRAGFRMNQDSEKFGRGLLESDLEFGLDVVDAGERESVRQCAMAGNVEPSANLLYLDVVHVDDFRELSCYRF